MTNVARDQNASACVRCSARMMRGAIWDMMRPQVTTAMAPEAMRAADGSSL